MTKAIDVDFSKMLMRPCIVISTVSENGVSNAAPFSFNSPATTKPPMYGFCCEVEHDTWRNIRANGEFVVNLVGASFGDARAWRLPWCTRELWVNGLGLHASPSGYPDAPAVINPVLPHSVDYLKRAITPDNV